MKVFTLDPWVVEPDGKRRLAARVCRGELSAETLARRDHMARGKGHSIHSCSKIVRYFVDGVWFCRQHAAAKTLDYMAQDWKK